MTTHQGPRTTTQAPRSLYVVELTSTTGPPTQLHRMTADLAATAVRLSQRGVDVALLESVVLPEDGRCLCLVLSTDRSTVALVCDTAGLTSAPVHEAYRYPRTTRTTPTTRTDLPPARQEKTS